MPQRHVKDLWVSDLWELWWSWVVKCRVFGCWIERFFCQSCEKTHIAGGEICVVLAAGKPQSTEGRERIMTNKISRMIGTAALLLAVSLNCEVRALPLYEAGFVKAVF